MSNIKKGDIVRIEGAVGPYPVSGVGAHGTDGFVDLWVNGRQVRVPEHWCEPVKRVPLTIVLANMIEDGDDRFLQTAVDALDVITGRLLDAGFALAANWLREQAAQR